MLRNSYVQYNNLCMGCDGYYASTIYLTCYETATFNTTTLCMDVTGTMPTQPADLACYETATFNTTTCV
ncbi:MAG: hypothetical protein R2805_06560 [Flavobacterium sp.]|uniref:hypothetical protein n=1 Tax=Flavobacterium sp. TaxID=239 RepID=UPI0035284115